MLPSQIQLLMVLISPTCLLGRLLHLHFQEVIFQVTNLDLSVIVSIMSSLIPTCLLSVNLFLPHLAVAFGYAPTFTDPKAVSFSLDKLLNLNLADASIKMLNVLRRSLTFDRFSGFSNFGIPMDPVSFEIFNVDNFLAEIQFSLGLSPSVDFSAFNFKASDLFDALFPTSIPTVKSFGSFIKKDILSKIRDAIGGLFDANVDVPTIGLSVGDLSFGLDGFDLGNYSEFNNELFPPMIDVDALQVSFFCYTHY
jgi:hypothetical protein